MNERQHLQNEINKLRHELSVTIPQEMQTAIESGDLKENSEFSDAVTRQYFAGIRLKQLIDRLNAYKEINLQNISRTNVGLGSLVKVKHIETAKIIIFKIVMGEITDLESNDCVEVTLKSPVGKALYNKSVSDQFTVMVPAGKATYKILKITTLHDL